MTETRQIVGHATHTLHGPHANLPVGFVPLRLCVQDERLHIDVTSPDVIVGRHSEVDLRLAFPEVSRRHCRLRFEDFQWRIYDLNSLNGIDVNNMRTAQATLYAGDVVRIGCVKLLVEAGTPLAKAKGKASVEA
jgi:pSer/pThr/pTyr-binding forkhead associated (FHA) protein